MSWVSQANIKNIMTTIRNKFTTGDLVIANDAKDTGVELNHTAQDGLVTVSPISTFASTEAALHLSNGNDTKKTELTQGTLSYVDSSSGSESYNYMSLLGDGVTFGKNGGGNVQVGGVADPTSAQQVATKNYVDSLYTVITTTHDITAETPYVVIPANSSVSLVYEHVVYTEKKNIVGAFSVFTSNESVYVATNAILSTTVCHVLDFYYRYNVTITNPTSSVMSLNNPASITTYIYIRK